MTIANGDIRIMKSQVMLDENDGGGAMTGNEVIDGVSNNMFPDIAELDRAYGRVSLRKVFTFIDTPNTDSAIGAHLIITKKPVDPNVSVTLFTTEDWFDRRPEAQNYIEQYLAKAPVLSGHLLETQLTGQRAIQIAMRENDLEPLAGQGLCLIQNEGIAGEYEQYVRVTAVSSVLRSFTYNNSDITRKVVTIEISDALRYDFVGQTVQQYESGATPLAKCRDTRVADAANYYSITDLEANVAINDATIQVESIFTQLVPSAQTETPLIDVNAAGENVALVLGNSGTITNSYSITVSTAQALYIGSAIMPSTMAFTLFGQSVTDTGGVLKTTSGTQVGNLNYQTGQITWLAAAGSGSTTLSVTFKPAAAPTQPFESYAIPVTADNRGYNWIATLTPIPAPATLIVSYMVQKKVYTLRDNGAGQLIGADSSFGSGSVSYTTGSVLLTTGELPDVGTPILMQWGTPITTFARADLSVLPAAIEFDLEQEGIAASSVTVSWLLEGVAKSATSNSAGNFTGDATGSVNYAKGTGRIVPNKLPQVNTVFTINYDYGTPESQTIDNVTPSGSQQLSFTIGTGTAIQPSSVSIEIPLTGIAGGSIEGHVTVHDVPINGTTGNLVDTFGTVMGTLTYATGAVSITPVASGQTYTTVYSGVTYTSGA